jgi:hypothetical protein
LADDRTLEEVTSRHHHAGSVDWRAVGFTGDV